MVPHLRCNTALNVPPAQESVWSPPAQASSGIDLPYDGRAMAVIDSAVALGALPGLDAEEPVLDLTDLSPNLAQAMLQAKLSALATMHSTTGCAASAWLKSQPGSSQHADPAAWSCLRKAVLKVVLNKGSALAEGGGSVDCQLAAGRAWA